MAQWVWLFRTCFSCMCCICVLVFIPALLAAFSGHHRRSWLGIAVLWLMMQMYFWPMLITQSNLGSRAGA